jgi:hypothetical protein
MPFTSTTVFDPDTLEILQRAYTEACVSLTGKVGFEPDEKARTALALRIMDLAATGEREPEKLIAHALVGLSKLESRE